MKTFIYREACDLTQKVVYSIVLKQWKIALCVLIGLLVLMWMLGKPQGVMDLNPKGRLERALTEFGVSLSPPPTPQSSSSPPRATSGWEHEMRKVIECILGKPFPKCRPRWLINPSTNRCLELDMYNEELRLAFEYDGAQHDNYTPHFHKNKAHFDYRKLLDKLKMDICSRNGVRLIRIPWQRTQEITTEAGLWQCVFNLLSENNITVLER